jgi:hypothetical protein
MVKGDRTFCALRFRSVVTTSWNKMVSCHVRVGFDPEVFLTTSTRINLPKRFSWEGNELWGHSVGRLCFVRFFLHICRVARRSRVKSRWSTPHREALFRLLMLPVCRLRCWCCVIAVERLVITLSIAPKPVERVFVDALTQKGYVSAQRESEFLHASNRNVNSPLFRRLFTKNQKYVVHCTIQIFVTPRATYLEVHAKENGRNCVRSEFRDVIFVG